MSAYYRHLVKNAEFVRLLDTYPAHQAFSIQQLKSSATRCLRVRRAEQVGSEDENNEMDIGFKDGWIDIQALWAFCALGAYTGQGKGYVTVWYDQQGFGRDVAQPTAANQPLIVTAGAVIQMASKPTIYFPNNTYLYRNASYQFPDAAQNYAMAFFVTQKPNTGHDIFATPYIFNFTQSAKTRFSASLASYTALRFVAKGMPVTTSYTITSPLPTSVFLTPSQGTIRWKQSTEADAIQLRRNGTQLHAVAAANNTAFSTLVGGTMTIGAAPGGGYSYGTGKISELILYSNDQTANMSAIETAQISAHGV